MPAAKSNAERFWPKVQMGDGCWLWTAARAGPYGTFAWRNGVNDYTDIGAHVAAWRLAFWHTALHVLHRCDTPLCVRPDHLFTGTQAINMADKVAKGRQPRGTQISWSRFTEGDIRDIFALALAGVRRVDIAAHFATTIPHISDILVGKTWGHLGLTPIPKLGRGRPPTSTLPHNLRRRMKRP